MTSFTWYYSFEQQVEQRVIVKVVLESGGGNSDRSTYSNDIGERAVRCGANGVMILGTNP